MFIAVRASPRLWFDCSVQLRVARASSRRSTKRSAPEPLRALRRVPGVNGAVGIADAAFALPHHARLLHDGAVALLLALLFTRALGKPVAGTVALIVSFGNVAYLGLPLLARCSLGEEIVGIEVARGSMHVSLDVGRCSCCFAGATRGRSADARGATAALTWGTSSGSRLACFPETWSGPILRPRASAALACMVPARPTSTATATRCGDFGVALRHVVAKSLGFVCSPPPSGLRSRLHRGGLLETTEAHVLVLLAAMPAAISTRDRGALARRATRVRQAVGIPDLRRDATAWRAGACACVLTRRSMPATSRQGSADASASRGVAIGALREWFWRRDVSSRVRVGKHRAIARFAKPPERAESFASSRPGLRAPFADADQHLAHANGGVLGGLEHDAKVSQKLAPQRGSRARRGLDQKEGLVACLQLCDELVERELVCARRRSQKNMLAVQARVALRSPVRKK
ncbi:MAG: hypothetical protein R3B99_26655 [Polyangiales bacterium]